MRTARGRSSACQFDAGPHPVDGTLPLMRGCTAGVLDDIPADPDAQHELIVANARRALAAGVTTVQDLGDGGYAVLAARDATRGDRHLPRILASGPPIAGTV